MPRAVFERVGPFEESVVEAACEDWEWATRARRRAAPVVFDPSAALDHPCMSRLPDLKLKAEQHQNPYRNFSETSRFRCFTVSMENRGDELGERRLTGWIAWYRFARREFAYAHGEAVVYANLRTVEDLNRARRTDREAA